MERDMLILVMDNRPFVVDTEKQELWQYNLPDNTVAFSALTKEGKLFSLELLGNKVVIPQEVILAPEKVSDWAKFGINVKSQEDGWGIFLGDEQLALRLAGLLPHIDIAGTDFTVDVRLHELRETEKPWNKLNLVNMEVDGEGHFVCFYDTVKHEEFLADETVLEMPENVVVLEIPNEAVLDPVATGRSYRVGDVGLLTRQPFQHQLSATVKPLADSGLQAFIDENIKRAAGDDNGRGRGR